MGARAGESEKATDGRMGTKKREEAKISFSCPENAELQIAWMSNVISES